MKIVDFGCGPGSIIEYLPNQMEYVGIEPEIYYIDSAKKKYGDRGSFICEKIEYYLPEKMNYCDIALAGGLLHHLDDENSAKLLKTANNVLKPGGRLVTIDNIYIKNQSFSCQKYHFHVRTFCFCAPADPAFQGICRFRCFTATQSYAGQGRDTSTISQNERHLFIFIFSCCNLIVILIVCYCLVVVCCDMFVVCCNLTCLFLDKFIFPLCPIL